MLNQWLRVIIIQGMEFPKSPFKIIYIGWGIVACPVIEATARPDLEDFVRTRSPGEVVTGRLSVRTSSGIMMVSILDRIDP